ncbi:hypothetical protein AK812_SmicGene39254 [Symbiodinium microadriaticum]|uniref:Uncharacterized protein n=1 Tax=Symbiodinium microadriaticum TaxID=2951 RepID=A0A1Q9CBQ3_SYMMI|nr:hypothetical protein AK812_SmicGene39254 [Symbiodinium microadriaticum]
MLAFEVIRAPKNLVRASPTSPNMAQLGVRMGGVVAVMVINNILLVLFAYFDSLGRYQTATDLAASQVFNLFLATLVNTAIVYNLIGINFYTNDDSLFGASRAELP